MNEQIKKAVEAIKVFWGNLTKKAKIILFSCLGAALLIAVITSILMNRTQYTVLYSGIDNSEAQEITNELRSMNVDYQYHDGTIYVEENSENSTRMQLANEGYPKSAPNYDFFTANVGVMTTDEERKIIERYQLETRLGSVIKTLDSVNSAYVTISLPDSTDYAWEENKSGASASVAIGLAKGKTLDAKQVNGIRQLVAKSVPNLDVEDVTIMDTSTGEELSAVSSSEPSSTMQITLSEFKLKIEKQYEESLENKILNLLAQAYGRNNLSVSVKSKMDLDKKIEDIVTYTPSTSDGKGVVSHSEETIETTTSSSAAGGVAGTTSNVDTTTTYPGISVSDGVITTKDSKTYDYLVSKVQQQVQSDAAALDDLTVAVVINTDNMTDSKKEEVTALVANAAAVDVSKVAIMAAAPTNSAVSQAEAQAVTISDLLGSMASNQLVLIILAVLFLLVILLIVLLAANRRKARREKMLANMQQFVPEELPEDETDEEEEEEAEEGDEEDTEGEETEEAPADNTQPQDSQEDEDDMQIESIEAIRNATNGKEQRVKIELQDFSDRNPEIAAQLIRSWLKGDDGKHG
jgi:flagellar M-ring protein FliF